jgi:hypothetical protein
MKRTRPAERMITAAENQNLLKKMREMRLLAEEQAD